MVHFGLLAGILRDTDLSLRMGAKEACFHVVVTPNLTGSLQLGEEELEVTLEPILQIQFVLTS